MKAKPAGCCGSILTAFIWEIDVEDMRKAR